VSLSEVLIQGRTLDFPAGAQLAGAEDVRAGEKVATQKPFAQGENARYQRSGTESGEWMDLLEDLGVYLEGASTW